MMRSPWSRLLAAGLVTGISDGLFAAVSSLFFGSTPTRVFQGVASTILGKAAVDGGTRTALIGLLMHFGVAFGWSAVFLFIVMRWPAVIRALQSRGGVMKVAAIYGPCIWLVMSLIVIPLLVHRPPTITARWWLQFFGHAIFVGLPIVGISARGADAILRRSP